MDGQERFADLPARCESSDEIDAAIDSWTAGQNHIDLMNALQHCGVSASAVMNGPQLLADPHLSAGDAFLEQDWPGLGVKHYPNNHFAYATHQRRRWRGRLYWESILKRF